MNLVVNARDAMPNGGQLSIETIHYTTDEEFLSVHSYFKPGDYILISVQDTGVGIEKELISKIFDPFFTTKDKGEGTGLGLSTVFGIVKQSEGYVVVESEVGKGTKFNIYLPKMHHISDEFVRPSDKNNLLRGTETILLAEDEKGLQTILTKQLNLLGYTVLAANNGQQALEIASAYNGTIDLLLTDVVMPGLSGSDLDESLRNYYPDVVTLFMSGYTDDEIVHQGVLDDDKLFIQKPFTPLALTLKLRETLKRKKN